VLDEGYAHKLTRALVDWEAFGILPGIEKMRLYVDRADTSAVGDCDLAFLWFAIAQATASSEDNEDERTQLGLVVDELSNELVKRATIGPSLVENWAVSGWDMASRTHLGGMFVLEAGVGNPDSRSDIPGTIGRCCRSSTSSSALSSVSSSALDSLVEPTDPRTSRSSFSAISSGCCSGRRALWDANIGARQRRAVW
jgi:hypothetical protein